MQQSLPIWAKPSDYLKVQQTDHPVVFFSPQVLQATARRFIDGFPGLVTYAVKANPDDMVLQNLLAAGIGGFDVASVDEIERVQRLTPGAAMHYNNPVRSRAEVARAVALGVRSYSVDSASELEKVLDFAPEGAEISVRFRMALGGAAYDFGEKFGVDHVEAVELLCKIATAGMVPSLTFHPGTQCTDPATWKGYISAAGRIADDAGVEPARLNVGGGFPSRRLDDENHDLEEIFDTIDHAATAAFGSKRPALVCEPGRGLVAECISLAARVRAVRDDNDVFLNDGVYGGFAEAPLIGIVDRTEVRTHRGALRGGPRKDRILFGPTCDSLDRLPGHATLPADIAEGDFVIFHGMGAYSTVTATRFNGFGQWDVATVRALSG